MTRKECLDKAAECVLKDRQNVYGKPEDCFGMIARMWGAYLGVCVSAHDVAAMMALLKIARFRHNPFHEDNAVDCAGYAACMVECATAWEREGEDEAEGGCCQDGKDQPEFKCGDRVQFRDEIPSTSEPHWFDGVYVERLSDGGHAVAFGPQGHVIHCSDKEIRPAPKAAGCEELVQEESEPEFNPRDRVQAKMGDGKWRDAFVSGKEIVSGKLHYTVSIHGFDGYYSFPAEDIRPAPKAEGCEALVEKDAPQTPAELYDRIIASNPATYGRPRKPTGEELAEMAEIEEDA